MTPTQRAIPLLFPPAGEGVWGVIQLPWPMTEEQWQALEAYMTVLKVGFVRKEQAAGVETTRTSDADPGQAGGKSEATRASLGIGYSPGTLPQEHPSDPEPSP